MNVPQDAVSLQIWILIGLVAVGGSIIAYMLNRAINHHEKRLEKHEERLEGTEDKLDAHGKALDAHRLHVSETYAKDATVQSSLARIHDRLDSLPKEIIAILRREQ